VIFVLPFMKEMKSQLRIIMYEAFVIGLSIGVCVRINEMEEEK
jgi:hypothetical protein